MFTSNDGYNWISVDDDRLYEGNSDRNTHVSNELSPAPVARSLRLKPIAWEYEIALRWDAKVQMIWNLF